MSNVFDTCFKNTGMIFSSWFYLNCQSIHSQTAVHGVFPYKWIYFGSRHERYFKTLK